MTTCNQSPYKLKNSHNSGKDQTPPIPPFGKVLKITLSCGCGSLTAREGFRKPPTFGNQAKGFVERCALSTRLRNNEAGAHALTA